MRIAVLGMGNVLMGDDALGPYALRVLEAAWVVPEAVTLLDVGTPGLDLVPYLADMDEVILIDTVRSEGSPGEIRTYRADQILRHPPQPRLGPHDPGLKEALLSLRFEGRAPREVFLVGAIPAATAMGAGLSAPLRAAVPAIVDEVLRELARLGHPAARRLPPVSPDFWWEAPPAPIPPPPG